MASIRRIEGFLEYLGTENTNLLTSLKNLRQEFDIFYMTDELFLSVVRKGMTVSEDDVLVGHLFGLTHFYFYFAISNLIRCHRQKAFFGVRMAIETALQAYRLIEGKGSQEAFFNEEKTYGYTVNFIRKARIVDPRLFPLAEAPIRLYESCNKFATHVTLGNLAGRMDVKDDSDSAFSYFADTKEEDISYFFYITVGSFLQLLKIFELWLRVNSMADENWTQKRDLLWSTVVKRFIAVPRSSQSDSGISFVF